MLLIRPFHSKDEAAVIELWHQCGLIVPQNDPKKDIERKLKINSELFLIGELDNQIIASCMAGYEGHRGWINYLAVAPHKQRNGIATQMMDYVEKLLHEIGCPKINLQIRSTNLKVIEFYKSIGFVQDDVLSFGKRIHIDDRKVEQDAAANP